MITILPETDGPLIALKAIGKLTDADYEDAVPKMEAIITREGKVKLIADLTEFEGWEWVAAWDDFAFGIKHWNDIDKMAFIGDKRWEELCAKVSDKLMHAEVKLFHSDDADAAWTWIRG